MSLDHGKRGWLTKVIYNCISSLPLIIITEDTKVKHSNITTVYNDNQNRKYKQK
jgi:hypothetical protein